MLKVNMVETPRSVKYDPQQKSWRGPIVGSQQTLPLTRHHKLRERQMSLQIPENVKMIKTSEEDDVKCDVVEDDDDDNDDVLSVCLDIDDAVKAKLHLPFHHKMEAVWKAPTLVDGCRPQSCKEFVWERPVSSRPPPVGPGQASARLRVAELETQLAARDGLVRLLRDQLRKAHEDNHRLAAQLDGYTGKHYNVLESENASLKAQVARLQRQNLRLEGEMKRSAILNKRVVSARKRSEERSFGAPVPASAPIRRDRTVSRDRTM